MAILDKINLNGEEREIADSEARQRLDDLAEVANTGDYNDLENKPDIPEAQVNADWAAESGVAAILNKPEALPNPMPLTFGNQTYDGSASAEITPESIGLGTVFNLKGSKGTVADLPETGNTIGDVWYVIAESVGYVWINDDGTERWEQLGLAIDLSNYVTNAALALAIAGKQNALTAGAGISITGNVISAEDKPWKFLRTVTIPEDITTDNSGVSFAEQTNGGVLFAFDTDENNNPFSYTELCCVINSSVAEQTAASTINLHCFKTPGYYSNRRIGSSDLGSGKAGKKVQYLGYVRVLYPLKKTISFSVNRGGASTGSPKMFDYLCDILTDTFIPFTAIGAYVNNKNGYGFEAGSTFSFYVR